MAQSMSNININSRVKHSKVSDLRHKDYLEIDLCGFRYADVRKSFSGCSGDCFGDCFREFAEKAKEKNLPQIRIKFPFRWDVFRRKLEKFCYRSGLIFVEMNISASAELPESFTAPKGTSANIKTPEGLTVLKNVNVVAGLLGKQQSLHHKFDPVFFEKPENFDTGMYLRQSQIDCKNSRGITYGIYDGIRDGDRLVAFINLEIVAGEVYINELFTDDEYRGQGLGKALMREGFGYASDLGFKKIWTTLAAKNHPAFLFYKSCGFKPTARLYYFDLE